MAFSAVAAAGVASPGLFRGAVWSPSDFKDLEGCATITGALPHWSKLTGDGKMAAAGAAATCSKARGGSAFESYVESEPELTVLSPVKIPSGVGGVNVTWDVVVAGSDAAAVTSAGPCPTAYSYSYHYNYGYTWYNYSYSDSYCAVQSELELYGDSYVINESSGGSIYSTNYWDLYNESGLYNDSYSYSATYSNSSYWASNYSYHYAYNYSYGPSGSISGSYAPTWFINSTFAHGVKYKVETYLGALIYCVVEGYQGRASATLNAATGPNHADLQHFSVW
jgi:hypothetical protein